MWGLTPSYCLALHIYYDPVCVVLSSDGCLTRLHYHQIAQGFYSGAQIYSSIDSLI